MTYLLESNDSGEVTTKHHVAIQSVHFTLELAHEFLQGTHPRELGIGTCTAQAVAIAFHHFVGARGKCAQFLFMGLSLLFELLLSLRRRLIGHLSRSLILLRLLLQGAHLLLKLLNPLVSFKLFTLQLSTNHIALTVKATA
jgi:hypothetical protein